MKIIIFGITGNAGQALLQEALSRGHAVTGTARETGMFHPVGNATVVAADVLDAASVQRAAAGHDAAIVAISGRKSGHGSVAKAAASLPAALAAAGVKRLLWVGGAGSLEVAPGLRLVDAPQFPVAYKDEALGQAAALDVLLAAKIPVNWTYVSPPALIGPGGRTGKYRTGGNQLLADAQGTSTISWIDYAVAVLDEIETNTHPNQRITVAY